MGKDLWHIDELTRVTGGRLEGACAVPLRGFSIDTRTLEPGDIFVALTGDNRDGHQFVNQALGAGAGLAIVSSAVDGDPGGPCLVVGDTLAALRDIAGLARARTKARILAVTGSVGKTSSKDSLKLALDRSGQTHASVASYNNHWGVPLSLARMPRSSAFGVFEVGMNHPGEIGPLSDLIRPDIALVTTVEPVHLGFFANVDDIAEAKAEIFSGLQNDAIAVLNRDNRYFGLLADRARSAGARVVGFGRHAEADARLIDLVLHESCSCVRADVMGHDVAYKIGAPGLHHVINSLGVLAASLEAGGDLALAALALENFRVSAGRGTVTLFDVPGGTVTLIDESYNANPASMRAALEVLGDIALKGHGRRIAVLGDMLELGDDAPALHAELVDAVTSASAAKVFLCGENMSHLWSALPDRVKAGYGKSSVDLEGQLVSELAAGDVVMIKGSLGSNMKPLVVAATEFLSRSGNKTGHIEV